MHVQAAAVTGDDGRGHGQGKSIEGGNRIGLLRARSLNAALAAIMHVQLWQ
jgi:hypothetical protein